MWEVNGSCRTARDVTFQALWEGINVVPARFADTWRYRHAIQSYVRAERFPLSRDFCGAWPRPGLHDAPSSLHFSVRFWGTGAELVG